MVPWGKVKWIDLVVIDIVEQNEANKKKKPPGYPKSKMSQQLMIPLFRKYKFMPLHIQQVVLVRLLLLNDLLCLAVAK